MVIAFYTYLSLSWIDMYSRPHILSEVVWEPRYFMPAIPAIALLGGAGIERLARIRFSRSATGKPFNHQRQNPEHGLRIYSVILVLLILIIIALPGILPALAHFQHPEESAHKQPRKYSPAIRVTTDQLITEPDRYDRQFVLVDDGEITRILPDGWIIRSKGALEQGDVIVHLLDWPADKRPRFEIGDEIVVSGHFRYLNAPDKPTGYVIDVKFGTEDFIRLVRDDNQI
jgi:hypothetical protein